VIVIYLVGASITAFSAICYVGIAEPQIKQIDNRPIVRHFVGNQVIVTAALNNCYDIEIPFVAIIEIRDSDDVTVSLQITSGVLQPNGQSEVGASWLPEERGQHELRAFAISDLLKAQILTDVKTKTIEIES
jgi:hypothetical protein